MVEHDDIIINDVIVMYKDDLLSLINDWITIQKKKDKFMRIGNNILQEPHENNEIPQENYDSSNEEDLTNEASAT